MGKKRKGLKKTEGGGGHETKDYGTYSTERSSKERQ